MKEINYNKLRTEILEDLICSRMIECKNNRTDMVRQLKLDDEDKHIRSTSVEKIDDQYLIGIDLINKEDMLKMGRAVEKFIATFTYYSFGKNYYTSKINILENELD